MSGPWYQDDSVTVWHGDCLDVLRTLPDHSVDAVVTDPPYGLEFMGKDWDSFKAGAGRNYGGFHGGGIPATAGAPSYNPSPNPTCRKCGGLKFLGTEGSGGRTKCKCEAPDYPNYLLPKMHAFQAWCELWATECLRVLKPGGHMLAFGGTRTHHRLACAIEDAGFEIRDSIAWLYASGFPKSLDVSKAINKAAGVEPDRVTENANGSLGGLGKAGWNATPRQLHYDAPATDAARRWQGWGTALKPAHEPIVVARKPLVGTVASNVQQWGTGALNIDGCRVGPGTAVGGGGNGQANVGGIMGPKTGDRPRVEPHEAGRWPPNVLLDPTTAAELPSLVDGTSTAWFFPVFRYEPKAPTHERPRDDTAAHPTVKPLDLMRWLVRLVTPPGGLVLDPFAGSGTTAEACVVEGLRCVTIERERSYLPLIRARLTKPIALDLFGAGD